MAIKWFKRYTNRGFTLIEVLFSLTICLLIVLNTVPIIRVIGAKDNLKINSSNFAIAAKQVSKILYTAKDLEIGASLRFKDNKDEDISISLNNTRLVKEPGFDILVHNVSNLIFYQQDKNIYMEIADESNTYTFLIGTDYQVEEEQNDEIIEAIE